MFQQDLAPLGSLTVSALVALLPLLTIFVLLGWLRVKAHWAGLASARRRDRRRGRRVRMPVGLALLSATEGAVFGLFPIMWIVFTAIWLYQLTVVSGRFDDLRTAFGYISDDPRCQAIIIAFCFGGLMEALAGFGAPVAITGVMLMGLGFSPIRAAVVVLLANTAPVAFGAIGTPIITAGALTNIPYQEIGAYVGRQTPLLAFIVPLLLVLLVDGARGVRETWPVALSVGVDVRGRPVRRVELHLGRADRHHRVPAGPGRRGHHPAGVDPAGRRGGRRAAAGHQAEEAAGDRYAGTGRRPRSAAWRDRRRETTRTVEQAPAAEPARLSGGRLFMAFFPYLLVIAVFCLAKLVAPLTKALAATDWKIKWPGLDGHVLSAAGKPVTTDGLQLPVAVVARHAAADLRDHHGAGLPAVAGQGGGGVRRDGGQAALRLPHGGERARPGLRHEPLGPDDHDRHLDRRHRARRSRSSRRSSAGSARPSPGRTRRRTRCSRPCSRPRRRRRGIDPTLLVAANTSGGVVGKMISPQNLTIAATAVGVVGRESDLFRQVRAVERRAAAGAVRAGVPAVHAGPRLDAAVRSAVSRI